MLPENVRIIENKEQGACILETEYVSILSDGTITTCCLDAEGELSPGNIMDISLYEALASQKRASIVKDVKTTRSAADVRGKWSGSATGLPSSKNNRFFIDIKNV